MKANMSMIKIPNVNELINLDNIVHIRLQSCTIYLYGIKDISINFNTRPEALDFFKQLSMSKNVIDIKEDYL